MSIFLHLNLGTGKKRIGEGWGGGVGQSREGVGHEVFEPCARGGSCNFQLPLGGGSPYFIT